MSNFSEKKHHITLERLFTQTTTTTPFAGLSADFSAIVSPKLRARLVEGGRFGEGRHVTASRLNNTSESCDIPSLAL